MEIKQRNINGELRSFSQLIGEYSISIPIIQRDYAQGRENQEEIRDSFLNMLSSALENDTPAVLDFVYGSLESGNLIPLDGQQRLTTLFLLHWYLALRDSEYEDFKSKMIDLHGNSKFAYETRFSSSEFCNALIQNMKDIEKYFSNGKENGRLSDVITDSSWYYLSWNNDPTIRAMLNMLNAINDKFRSTTDFYKKLINNDNAIIKFQFLRLDDFKLSDDIYIKMNARGKLLTKFESFKAWLQTFVNKNAYEIETPNWDIKLDVDWTDLFWTFKQNGKFEIDEEYYEFFKIMTLYFYGDVQNANLYDGEVGTLTNELLNSESIRVSTLEKVLNEDSLNKIFNTLSYFENDGLNSLEKTFALLFEANEFIFNKLFGYQNRRLTLPDRTFLYSFIIFLLGKNKKITDYNAEDNKQIFRWIRICKNLVYNTIIDRFDEFINAISQLNRLFEVSQKSDFDIYDCLANKDVKISFLSPNQMEEERIKSKLIINDASNNWEDEFIKTEKHSYFNGQIGFLLEFSKNGNDYIFDAFKKYFEKAAPIFDDIIYKSNDYLFERALFSKGNYLIKKGYHNDNLCKPEAGTVRLREENWRRVFREKQDLLKSLFDDISTSDIKNELERIIKDFIKSRDSGSEQIDWRYHFVRNKEVFSYCRDKLVRMHGDDDITLLTKTQLNGYHAELYTYSFYVNFLKDHESKYLPLIIGSYREERGDEFYPDISISMNFKGQLYEMTIYYNREFVIKVKSGNESVFEDDVKEILRRLNLTEEDNTFIRHVGKNNERELLELIENISKEFRLLTSIINNKPIEIKS